MDSGKNLEQLLRQAVPAQPSPAQDEFIIQTIHSNVVPPKVVQNTQNPWAMMLPWLASAAAIMIVAYGAFFFMKPGPGRVVAVSKYKPVNVGTLDQTRYLGLEGDRAMVLVREGEISRKIVLENGSEFLGMTVLSSGDHHILFQYRDDRTYLMRRDLNLKSN